MRNAVKRMRLLREEGGFTLPELLVTMLMMLTVMFALYSIFDMSLRVFSFGNDKIEATENARLGLEKMEREIRAAQPQRGADGDKYILDLWTGDTVKFKHEGSSGPEQVTYSVYPTGAGSYALGRAKGTGNNEPVVEYVKEDGLKFEYLKSDGTEAMTESDVEVVRILLEINKDERTQTLTTSVALRNRVGRDG